MMFSGKYSKAALESDRKKFSNSQSYWAVAGRQLKKNKPAKWALRFLAVLVFVALFGDFIANEKPLYCKLDGKTYYPVLKEYAVSLGWDQWAPEFFSLDWKAQDYSAVVWAPIAYSAHTIDRRNTSFRSPFDDQRVTHNRFWHWLGTDEIGRDVAAGMVAGTRTAMLVGVVAMSIATIIGIFFGAIAGFFGDRKLEASGVRIVLYVLGLWAAIFYGFMVRSFGLAEGPYPGWEYLKGVVIALLIFCVANGLASLLERVPRLGRKYKIPIDLLIMRIIEVFNSIPGLLLVLAILAVIEKPNIFNIMVIIGCLAWTGIARFIRAELLRVRTLEYIKAAEAMGFSNWRIILRHAIPNAIGPVLVAIAFGVAGAILVEAALTFIGIGLSIDQVTWGSLLNEARRDFSAWWVALIPGFAIFVTVTVFNIIGDALSTALDPRLQ